MSERNTVEVIGTAGNDSLPGEAMVTDPPLTTLTWDQHAIPWVDIMLALFCILLTLVSTCGNAVAIRSILKLKAKRFTDRNNLGSLTLVIFLNLASCDFLQTLLSAPFASLMLFNGRVQAGVSPRTEAALCNIAGVCYFIMSRASISIVAVLSLVRCYVILRPMNHHSVVNWKNVMIALGVVWFTATFLSAIPFMFGGTYRYWRIYPMCEWDTLETMFPWKMGPITLAIAVTIVYVTPFLLPGFVVITSSLVTVGALLWARHRKMIATTKRQYSAVSDTSKSISRKQLSAAITTLMIVTVFIGCYGMWWWNSLMYLLWKAGLFPTTAGGDGFIFTETYGETGYVYVATMGGLLLIYLNSALNPIIYYCRIFSKNSSDYKTSSSGPKGHQSSSSIEYRHSVASVGVRTSQQEGEKMLDTLMERDESPVTSDSMA